VRYRYYSVVLGHASRDGPGTVTIVSGCLSQYPGCHWFAPGLRQTRQTARHWQV